VWLAIEPRNADWGFEEFLTEFAQPHWAVEAKLFCPTPALKFAKSNNAVGGALRGGAERTRTSNQTVIAETRVNQGSPH
jgi:hypothetical protein